MNTYTDDQLKKALAKMLPEQVEFDLEQLWWRDELTKFKFRTVNETELLHLCWMVECSIPTGSKWAQYIQYLAHQNNTTITYSMLATWQQRIIALCKVKGVEI